MTALPDPCIEPRRRTIDDLPFWVILLGMVTISATLVTGAAIWVNHAGVGRERDREQQRELCLDRGGLVNESDSGRYTGCLYGATP